MKKVFAVFAISGVANAVSRFVLELPHCPLWLTTLGGIIYILAAVWVVYILAN